MEPGSWSDDMTELERQLLEAARADRAPEALSAKMAQGLQVGGPSVAAGTAAGKAGASLFAKAGLWGTLSLGALAVTSGWYATRETPATPAPQEAQQGPQAAQPPQTVQAELPAPAAESPAAEDDARPAPQGANPDDSALRAEVALLARARGALQERASSQALVLLDRHRERFARGTLRPEAAALRIEALMQQGSYEAAESQTDQFVKSYPSHPLATHVAELIAARSDVQRR